GPGIGIAGEHDPLGVRAGAAQDFEQLGAAHLGHSLIGDDHGKRPLSEQLERLGAAGGRHDVEMLFERSLENDEILDLVVDVQDVSLHQAVLSSAVSDSRSPSPSGGASATHGKRMTNSVPSPGLLVHWIVPPSFVIKP